MRGITTEELNQLLAQGETRDILESVILDRYTKECDRCIKALQDIRRALRVMQVNREMKNDR